MARDAIAPLLRLGYLLLRRLADLLDQFGEIAIALLQEITAALPGGCAPHRLTGRRRSSTAHGCSRQLRT